MRVKHELGNCIVWLVIVMLLVTSCGVSALKKRYPPEVVKEIEKIMIFRDEILYYRDHCIELGFIEVHDNPLNSWEYIEFMAKAQAYQRYGADVIIRTTYDVESPNPPYGMEKFIRGTAIRCNQEAKAAYKAAYDEWRKEQIKQKK